MELKIHNILRKEYFNKLDHNPAYSIRAFARDIGVGKTTLHEILNNDKKLNQLTCERVLEYLEYPEDLKDLVLNYNLRPESDENYKELTDEEFKTIATCEHYGVLSLARTGLCEFNKNSLAERLDISVDDLEEIVDDLKELDLIAIKENYLHRTPRPLTTSYDIKSSTIRGYHKNNLDKIKGALDGVEVDLRDIASSTFLMEPAKIKVLKRELKSLRRKLVSDFENEGKESEVFLLNFSLIPISRRSLNEE